MLLLSLSASLPFYVCKSSLWKLCYSLPPSLPLKRQRWCWPGGRTDFTPCSASGHRRWLQEWLRDHSKRARDQHWCQILDLLPHAKAFAKTRWSCLNSPQHAMLLPQPWCLAFPLRSLRKNDFCQQKPSGGSPELRPRGQTSPRSDEILVSANPLRNKKVPCIITRPINSAQQEKKVWHYINLLVKKKCNNKPPWETSYMIAHN